MIKCILNPFLSEKREVPHFVGGDQIEAVSFFHQSLPGYAYTPLLKLEGLAAKFKINSLILKDESQRFELKAFGFGGKLCHSQRNTTLAGIERRKSLL